MSDKELLQKLLRVDPDGREVNPILRENIRQVAPPSDQRLRQRIREMESGDEDRVFAPEPGVGEKMFRSLMPATSKGAGIDDPFPQTRPAAAFAGGLLAGQAAFNLPIPHPIVKGTAVVVATAAGGVTGLMSPEMIVAAGKKLGLVDPKRRMLRSDQLLALAHEQAQLDFLLGPLASAAKPAGIAKDALARKIARVGPESRIVAQHALRRFGIPMDIVSLSRGRVATGFGRVMGVFPWIGTPLLRAAKRRGEDTVTAANRWLVNTLGPVGNEGYLGRKFVRAGRDLFSEFSRNADNQFRVALKTMMREDLKVLPTNARAKAQEFMDVFDASKPAIRKKDGTFGKQFVEDPLRDLLQAILSPASATGRLNINQIQNIDRRGPASFMSQISELLGKTEGLNHAKLLELQEAFRQDILQNSITRSGRPSLGLVQFNEATEYYRKGLNTFDSTTARRFRQVDEGLFRGAQRPRAGGLSRDRLFELAFDPNSGDSMFELRRLVGRENFVEGLNNYIATQMNKSMKVITEASGQFKDLDFDPTGLREALGLTADTSTIPGAISKKGRSLKAAFRAAGIRDGEKHLEQLISTMEQANQVRVGDPASMVVRRATLGGWRTAMKTIVPSAAVSGGYVAATGEGEVGVGTMLGSLMLAAGARHVSHVISRPGALRLFAEASNEAASRQVRRINALRFVSTMLQMGHLSDEQAGAYEQFKELLKEGGKKVPSNKGISFMEGVEF